MLKQESLSIYIHIPFCRSRCNYCDFNTYAGMESHLDDYVQALVKEINLAVSLKDYSMPVHSIYFGGGTPTIMKPKHFEMILNAIQHQYSLAEKLEISSEANPAFLNRDYLSQLFQMGVKRLSMGMQSSNVEELKLLGRKHQLNDVTRSMDAARQSGFENINLDLIFGLPYQTLTTFQQSIDQALALSPEHLSIYSLTIEDGTPLERMLSQGKIPAPDKEVSADMYEWVMEYLAGKGYDQYEISNWAVGESYQCQHNLQYWHNQYYLGIGAGAHSYYDGLRWANTAGIPDYIQKIKGTDQWAILNPPTASEVISLTESDEIQETMMMGLRLVKEGVSEEKFMQRFGKNLYETFPNEISFLMKNDLLEKTIKADEHIYRVTHKGTMLGNQVFLQFIQA
jgi:oxygen-independent coproporphyrinogen-3 oxidase